jgi:hypothetical protein
MDVREPLFLLAFVIIGLQVTAQIGGLSGSKLNSLCVDPVNRNQFEFEPGFSCATSKKFWNNAGEPVKTFHDDDSLITESGLRFRFTYGVTDKMEIGVTIPGDMTMSSWGIKYALVNKEKSALAITCGINYPFGNGIKNKKDDESAIQVGLGAIYTWSPTDVLSVDFSAQGAVYFSEPESTANNYLSISADAGYYFFDGALQLAGGLGFQQYYYDTMKQYVLTLYPGVTIETGKDFVITIIHSVDLLGRNIEKQHITDLSFTFTIR